MPQSTEDRTIYLSEKEEMKSIGCPFTGHEYETAKLEDKLRKMGKALENSKMEIKTFIGHIHDIYGERSAYAKEYRGLIVALAILEKEFRKLV